MFHVEHLYVEPIIPNEVVVQGLCDIMLSQTMDSTFHPHSDSAYRKATKYIYHDVKRNKFSFHSFYYSQNVNVYEIHNVDVKTAFNILINNGYYIFKGYEFGSWMGYVVRFKPTYKNMSIIYEFNDSIE